MPQRDGEAQEFIKANTARSDNGSSAPKRRIGRQRLCALLHYLDPHKTCRAYHFGEKARRAAPGFDETHMEIGSGTSKDDPGQSGSTADVEDKALCGEFRKKNKGIGHMLTKDGQPFPLSSQPNSRVPDGEQLEKNAQTAERLIWNLCTILLRCRTQDRGFSGVQGSKVSLGELRLPSGKISILR